MSDDVSTHGFTLPDKLVEAVSGFHGGLGLPWLERLPGVLDACVGRWGLSLGAPYSYPSLSYVAPVRRSDGSEAVLKVGFLLDELACEIAALRHYDGQGSTRLLDADPELGALLLERVLPGDNLIGLPDSDAVSAAASVMGQLWRPAPENHAFPSVETWHRGFTRLREHFGGTTGPFPKALVEEVEGLYRDLLASAGPPVLLHGDLQHFNVLSAQRSPWLVIDPKGVVGEPAYEIGAYLRNEWEDARNPSALTARRVAQFSEELGLDEDRVRGWGLYGAVLSAWWSVEDTGDGWRTTLRLAELMWEGRVVGP
ncbi:MAG TPA: aminoglycoside phosphotransferase family protein [Armatimonadota bacterium]|jgi:streptomycin 6-kinase